jgi:hypothetical protein
MFTVPVDPAATSYLWTVPSTVTIVSGQGNDTLVVSFGAGFVNSANKQIRVTALSGCGNSGLYIHYLAAQGPGTPTGISGPTEVCSYIENGTEAVYSINPVTAASSYSWTVPAGAQITQYNGASINVTFNSNFISGNLSVRAVNNCGTGSARNITVGRTGPGMPGTISGPLNTCLYMPSAAYPSGLPATYSITKVSNASSYNWSVPAGITISNHSSTLTEDMITANISNAFVSGNITVSAANFCGTSAARSIILKRSLTGGINNIAGPTDACGHIGINGMPATYTASTAVNANFYNWAIPAGALSVTGQGTNTISFIYPAGFTTGTITVTASNGCGNGGSRSLVVSKLVPVKPAEIIETIIEGSCPNRYYTYSLPYMPLYAQTIQWEVPVRASIVSGQGTMSITVYYDATALTGLVSAIPQNDCGTGTARRIHVDIPVCPPFFTGNANRQQKFQQELLTKDSLSVDLFPNPALTNFMIKVNSRNTEAVKIDISDLQGRLVRSITINANELNNIGAELKAGMYLIQIRQGAYFKTIKGIKL